MGGYWPRSQIVERSLADPAVPFLTVLALLLCASRVAELPNELAEPTEVHSQEGTLVLDMRVKEARTQIKFTGSTPTHYFLPAE